MPLYIIKKRESKKKILPNDLSVKRNRVQGDTGVVLILDAGNSLGNVRKGDKKQGGTISRNRLFLMFGGLASQPNLHCDQGS